MKTFGQFLETKLDIPGDEGSGFYPIRRPSHPEMAPTADLVPGKVGTDMPVHNPRFKEAEGVEMALVHLKNSLDEGLTQLLRRNVRYQQIASKIEGIIQELTGIYDSELNALHKDTYSQKRYWTNKFKGVPS